jgi:hypothetical protein
MYDRYDSPVSYLCDLPVSTIYTPEVNKTLILMSPVINEDIILYVYCIEMSFCDLVKFKKVLKFYLMIAIQTRCLPLNGTKIPPAANLDLRDMTKSEGHNSVKY